MSPPYILSTVQRYRMLNQAHLDLDPMDLYYKYTRKRVVKHSVFQEKMKK